MSFHSSQWKTTTTKSGWTNADPQPSGMEVWAASPGKEPRPTEVLAKGKGTEKGSYKYQLQKKEDLTKPSFNLDMKLQHHIFY